MACRNSKQLIWVFDVCDTLYYSNTTFDFLDYLFVKIDSERRNLLREISRKNSLRFYYRAIWFKLFGVDLYKRAAVRLLTGLDERIVKEAATLFVKNYLETKAISETHSLLEDQIENALLVSNSLDIVIDLIAEHLNVDSISSRTEIKNGKYTGRIAEDITGLKHQKLAEMSIDDFAVVTDNKSDFELVKLARFRFIVIHNHKEKKVWESLNPEFIYP